MLHTEKAASVEIDETALYCVTLGAGVPLVVMHGGMGFDHTYFRPWLDPLSEKAELIYYDHRGNGRSSLMESYDGFDAATWVSDADALRARIGHEKIILLGHSAGGFIAQEYALRFGDRLSGLILCNTAPALDYPEVMMANAKTRATDKQFSSLVRAFTERYDDETFRKLTAEILPVYFRNYNEDAGRRFIEHIRFNVAPAWYCSSRWFPVFNTLDQLDGIKVPTLIIAGREDWVMPATQGSERLHSGIAGSELVIFAESGHFPFIEEREKFLEVVGDWIERHRYERKGLS